MKKLAYIILISIVTGFMACTDLSSQESGKTEKLKNSGNKVEQINTATFKEKIFNFDKNKDWKYEGKIPCIVDFYADWCRPCKMIAPYLEDLAEKYKGKIVVFKVNIDNEKQLAGAFGISSIPAVMFCPMDGKPNMSTGALPKEEYEKMIKEILLKEPVK